MKKCICVLDQPLSFNYSGFQPVAQQPARTPTQSRQQQETNGASRSSPVQQEPPQAFLTQQYADSPRNMYQVIK